MNPQKNHWLALSLQDVPKLMKTKHPLLMVTSGGDVVLHSQHGSLNQVSGGVSSIVDREGSFWKTLRLSQGLCTMPHNQGNPVFSGRKFLPPHCH